MENPGVPRVRRIGAPLRKVSGQWLWCSIGPRSYHTSHRTGRWLGTEGFPGTSRVGLRLTGLMRLVLLLLFAAQTLYPCSCGSYEIRKACEIFSKYQVSFRGRVVDRFLQPGRGFGRLALYRFEVLEVFRGLPVGLRYVFVDPASFTSCMHGFQIGGEYLVYAGGAGAPTKDASPAASSFSAYSKHARFEFPHAWKDLGAAPVLLVVLCNPTRQAQPADPDLDYLRRAALIPPKTPGWIGGRVIQNYSYPDTADRHVPVEDAMVTVSTPSRKQRTERVNPDGTFRVDGLPPGRYVLGFQSPSFSTGGPYQAEVSVPAGGCSISNPSFDSRASISGRVLDWRGRPLQGIPLDLHQFNKHLKHRWVPGTHAQTDRHGRFRIEPAPSGSLVVGVNLGGAATRHQPFDPTYAPGTHDLRHARVLQVAPGDQISNFTLRLPKPHPIAQLTVDVFWPDGSPAKDRVRASAMWRGHPAGRGDAPANSNRVMLYLVPGRRYEISAEWLNDRPDGFWMAEQGAPVPVTFTHTGQRIKVVLAPSRILE